MSKCHVCFRQCDIADGQLGFCKARSAKDGKVYPVNYGRVTSLALDPIEKKPLNRFHPGTKILSVGSYGCNLRCPFCQNSDISWDDNVTRFSTQADTLSPEELADIATGLKEKGNIGVAYTYNEPLIGYEYVRDCAKLIHDMGMFNVIVTNGTTSSSVLDEMSPYIDAMNIDLKGFKKEFYKDTLCGDRDMVFETIKKAHTFSHVELTTLVVTDLNDSDDEMREISGWIADIDPDIPLHISRFFPRFHMTDRSPTPVDTIYHLADIAREKLNYVYEGNV